MRKSTYKLGQKEHSHKKLFVVLGVILLFAIAISGYYLLISKRDTAPKQDGHNIIENKTVDNDNKDIVDTRADESPKKTPPKYEGDDVNNTDSLSGIISHKSVLEDKLVIRTVINQLVQSGSCKITLSMNERVITETTSILQDPSSSTCEGFDIPLSKLGPGNWNIVIEITDNTGRTGKISSEVII